MKSKEIEGQINLFGNEPYQPKKAKPREEPKVELDTEAEEFFSVGRKRKSRSTQGEEPSEKNAGPKEVKAEGESIPEPEAKDVLAEGQKDVLAAEPKEIAPKTVKKHKPSKAPVMQKSFSDSAGKTVTAAYLDYNLVYVQEKNGRASLTHYPESKAAVDAYLSQVDRFSREEGMKRTEDHPVLKSVELKEFEES